MIAQAFAGVASLTILHFEDTRSHTRLCEQLQGALDSRVVIEQAKGYLARSYGESPDTAFLRLRSYPRNRGLRLTVVAEEAVSDRITVA